MPEVNLDRMEKLINMGFEKEEAYKMVQAEANESENNSKASEENDELKKLKAELEEARKELENKKGGEGEGEKDPPKTSGNKEIDPKTLKKKNEDEPEYIQVLKKFC